MASMIDICNLALSHLGEGETITDLEEGSVNADRCGVYYPIALDQMLERHDWGFATFRVTLALLSDDTGTAWLYSYAVPTSYVRSIAVLQPEANDKDGQPFDIETLSTGDLTIYTNAEDAILRYVKRVTDTAKFTPLFVVALSRLLAAYLAGPIIKGTDGMRVGQAQMQQFEADLARAKSADANSRHVTQDHIPGAIAARGGSNDMAHLRDGRIIR